MNMLLFVFLSLLAYYLRGSEAHCSAVLGTGIMLRDCLRARAAIFSPSLIHLSLGDFIIPRHFGLHHPLPLSSLPIGGKFGTCALGIDIAAGHGTTAAVSYLYLYQRILELIRTCVSNGQTGGTIDDGDHTGIVFVLVNPRQVSVIHSCMSSAQSGRMDLRQCMIERALAAGQGSHPPLMPPAPYEPDVVDIPPQPIPVPHAPSPQSFADGQVRYRPGEAPTNLSGAWNTGPGLNDWLPAMFIIAQWLHTAGWLLLRTRSPSHADLPFPNQTPVAALGAVWLSRGGRMLQLAGAWIAQGHGWQPLGGELDIDSVPQDRWILLLGLSREVIAQQRVNQQVAVQQAAGQGANIQLSPAQGANQQPAVQETGVRPAIIPPAPAYLGGLAQGILAQLPGGAPALQRPVEDETSSTAQEARPDFSGPITSLRTIRLPQEAGIPVRLMNGDLLILAGVWEFRQGAWHALGPGRHPIWGQNRWWLLLGGTGLEFPSWGMLPGPQGQAYLTTYPGQRIQLTGAWLMQGGPWQAVIGQQPAGGPWTARGGRMLLEGKGAPPEIVLLPGPLPPPPEVTLFPATTQSLLPVPTPLAPNPLHPPSIPAQLFPPSFQPQPQPPGDAAGAAQAGSLPNIRAPPGATLWAPPLLLGATLRGYSTLGHIRIVAGIWVRRGGQWVQSHTGVLDAAWRDSGSWFLVLGRGVPEIFPPYQPALPPAAAMGGNVVGVWLSDNGDWQLWAESAADDWWRRGKWYLGKLTESQATRLHEREEGIADRLNFPA